MATSPTHAKPKSPDTDDDLDDLDDVLSEFDTTEKQPGSLGRPRSNTRVAPPGRVTGSPNDIPEEFADAFTRELAKGMESLIGAIHEHDPSTFSASDHVNGDPDMEEQRKEVERTFRAAWEAMLVEGMEGVDTQSGQESSADATGAGSSSAHANTTERKFQDRLKQAMDKMKETESYLQADPHQKEPGGPETLADLLRSIKDHKEGEENEQELAGFLEDIMGQLLSKEVLYEPLKELCDKFPNYLSSPLSTLSTEDRQRYEKQQACAKKILAIFDAPSYRDDDAKSHQTIVDYMSEIQSYGSPPPELMGPLPSGVPLGPDGLPQLSDNCVVS